MWGPDAGQVPAYPYSNNPLKLGTISPDQGQRYYHVDASVNQTNIPLTIYSPPVTMRVHENAYDYHMAIPTLHSDDITVSQHLLLA